MTIGNNYINLDQHRPILFFLTKNDDDYLKFLPEILKVKSTFLSLKCFEIISATFLSVY